MAFVGVLSVFAALLPGALFTAASATTLDVSYTLEGCNLDHGATFSSSTITCSDDGYTTGNLGKSWAELDLVPFRVELDNTHGGAQTGSFVVAGDYKNGSGTGTGWDVISDLTLNSSLSSSTGCPATLTATTTITPSGEGVGGADQTIYRLLTASLGAGADCVYDYYMRLALGAHNFSGSSLQANLWSEDLDSGTVGEKRVSIPVAEIAPQELSKTMVATRGTDHQWVVTKSPTPATLTFTNTCDVANGSRQASVDITVTWTKQAAEPSGPVTVTVDVYATNPAHRSIDVLINDKIREGSTVGSGTLLDNFTGTDNGANAYFTVPANTANQLVLERTVQLTTSATSLNDVATGSYKDTITGLDIPQTTTANATATVQNSGPEQNGTATITDSESITGTGLSFSVAAPSVGSFTGGYTAGTHTTGPVGWTSGTQSDSGSVTFHKTVYVDQPRTTSGTLSDTATLAGSDGASASGDANVDITATAVVSLTINKTIPNVLTGAETASFDFQVSPGSSFDSGNIIATKTISFSAGQTSKSATVTGLDPGTYTVHEVTPSGSPWAQLSDQTQTITLPSCLESVSFSNHFTNATARVSKVTVPPGGEAGWTFTLTYPDGTTTQTATTNGTGFANFPGSLTQEGTYSVTETSGPPATPGYDQTSPTGACTFTVNYPADAGKEFSCTFTNTQRGKAKVIKTLDGAAANLPPAGSGFTFQLREGASTTQAGIIRQSMEANSSNGGILNFTFQLHAGQVYAMCEVVMPGFATNFPGSNLYVVYNPSGDNSVLCADFTAQAGVTTTFNVDNASPPGGRALTIGFWKNWGSCSGSKGKQRPVLDQTLAGFPIASGQTTHGVYIGDLYVDTCQEAVAILSKKTLTGQSKSSDPAFNLAAQLLAAKLNVQAGAGVCPAAVTAINSAQTLLDAINFNGVTHNTMTAAQKTQANNLANTLDRYNNDTLC